MWETWVWSLGWEDPLEKGPATHPSILAWRIPWTIVHRVTKNQTQPRDFLLYFQTTHGTTDYFRIGKGVCQGCILSPCLFNLNAEYIIQNARLDETQARIKISGRNINNLRYGDDVILMAESKRELKSLLVKVRESGKAGLKLNIQKTKIMASGPITSWQIEGKTVKTVTDFIFLGSKSTADGECSHEIKTPLLLGRKAMTNLDSILKSFANKGPSSQSYGFSSSHAWMWELDHKEKLNAKELMLLKCSVGEDSSESLGLQGDQTSQS